MFAIYRKELKLYFCSFFTYLILAAILLVFGIFSSAFNLFMGYASLAFPLGYMGIVAILSAPLLTLLQSRRERMGDTEKLVLSLPVSPAAIVLGRFLASLTLLSIPTLIMALVPLLFAAWGGNALPSSEMSVLGYFLLCALFLAISQFVLFFFKNKKIGIAVAIGIPILLYAIHSVLSLFYLDEVIGKLILLLDPIHHFFAFTYGSVDIPSLIYLLSLFALFLLLSILYLKKQRGDFYAPQSRLGFRSLCAILVTVVLAMNVASIFIPEKYAKTDVSGLNIFRISGKTSDTLRELKEDVTVYFLCKGGEKKADTDLYSFLKKYTWESNNVRVQVIDTEKDPDFIKAYTEIAPSDQSMLVVSEKRHFIVNHEDLYYYENAELGIRIPSDYYAYLLQSYLNFLQTGSTGGLDTSTMSLAQQLYYSTATSAFFNGESVITNALLYVTADTIPNIYVLMDETFSIRDEYLRYFRPELLMHGYYVKSITSPKEIPADCDILFMFPIKQDLTQDEATKLRSYLANDGKMILFTESHPEFTNFYSVLSEYGLHEEAQSNLLCEGKEENVIVKEYNIFNTVVKESGVAEKFEGSFVTILPHSIVLQETEGVKLTPWITTTNKGYLVTEGQETDEDTVYDTYTLGALAEKGETRIAWISSPLSLSYTMGENLSSGGNYRLILSAVEWLNPSPYADLSISATKMVNSAISISDKDLPVWIFLFVFPLPAMTLTIGGIRTYVRKKK